MAALESLKAHADEFSKKYKLRCEVIEYNGQLYSVIKDLKLRRGKFNQESTDLAFTTDQQYPISAMDMFWVDESLLLADNSVAPASEELTDMMGKKWRRFSRHRGAGSPAWDPNKNGIEQQYLLSLIDLELKP